MAMSVHLVQPRRDGVLLRILSRVLIFLLA